MNTSKCKNCNKRLCAAKIPVFTNLDCAELEEVVQVINHRIYNKHDIIFNEGEPVDSFYFVNEGKIKLYKYNKDGKEQILHILSDGDFFGELNLFTEGEYKFNAETIEKTKVCSLTKENFRNIILRNPEISIKMMESLGERLSVIENLAQNLSTNDIDARIAYLLINLMDKYSETKEGVKIINLPLSREDMANYIGVTRETISRKLKKFELEGIINIIGTKNIEILDEESLRDYL